MENLITVGFIAVAILAVLGLGIKVAISFKSGSKSSFKNIQAEGDVVGRDKVQK
ncbi:MAG: hypothetical protein KA748_08830 [Halomonas sp.]|nr:hypothetical protein [Halomonas sp.]MBP5980298.1 hypothetical protein [Halomonas sp.]